MLPSVSLDKGRPKGQPHIPQIFSAPETIAGELASGVAQFLTGFAAGGRMLKGVKTATTAGKIGMGMAKGAISDFPFSTGRKNACPI